jgi:hypothetical protein
VKYEATETFWNDFRRLARSERELFWAAVREMNAASARQGKDPRPRWPAALRVKSVRSESGVFELTWSFAGPDGRATFEYITIEGELGIRWRRIGGHEIFQEP